MNGARQSGQSGFLPVQKLRSPAVGARSSSLRQAFPSTSSSSFCTPWPGSSPTGLGTVHLVTERVACVSRGRFGERAERMSFERVAFPPLLSFAYSIHTQSGRPSSESGARAWDHAIFRRSALAFSRTSEGEVRFCPGEVNHVSWTRFSYVRAGNGVVPGMNYTYKCTKAHSTQGFRAVSWIVSLVC